MQFDWFTFGAQIINFLLLLVLLRRFLYRPISAAIAAREERIAARFREAEKIAAEARREAELFHKKRVELEVQRAQTLAEAVREAASQRKQMLHQARTEVDDARQRWYSAIEREKALFLTELRQRATGQVFAIARQALQDLGNADLEEQIVAVFIQRLQRLDEEERDLLTSALKHGDQSVVTRSAFDLTDLQRQHVNAAVGALFEQPPTITFEHDINLLCGIELQVYGHRIAWSLRNYLQNLEEDLAAFLVQEHGQHDVAMLSDDHVWREMMLATQTYDA